MNTSPITETLLRQTAALIVIRTIIDEPGAGGELVERIRAIIAATFDRRSVQ